MYSLTEAATLGHDLLRLPQGDRVAMMLLTALSCDHSALTTLAAYRADPLDRTRIWARLRSAGAVQQPAPEPEVSADLLLAHGPSAVEPTRRSGGRTEGNVDALVRFVHHDALAWCWRTPAGSCAAVRSATAARGADVLADAAVACFVPGLAPADSQRLSEGYWQARPLLALSPPDLGPNGVDIGRTLVRLRHLDGFARDRLLGSVVPTGGVWASAMRDASWAIRLTGRERAAGTAVLLAVRAFHESGLADPRLDVEDRLIAWSVVSGYILSLVVSDLCHDDTAAMLRAGWRAVYE